MPVIQRQVINRGRGPSGFEKILSALQVGAGVANTVVDLVTGPERRENERRRVELGEANFDLLSEIQTDQAQRQRDTLTMSTATALLTASRNAALPNLTPEERMELVNKPYRIGDLPSENLRNSVREVVARHLQVEDTNQIPDDFIVTQDNVKDLLDNQIAQLTMRNLIGMMEDDPAALDSLTNGALAAAMGLPPGTVPSKFHIDTMFSNFVSRDLLRVENINGEPQVTGALVNNPGMARRMAFESVGLTPLNEIDVGGRRVVVPESILDTVYERALLDPFRDEDARQDAELQLVNSLSSRLGMPRSVAAAIADGNLETVPEQWKGLAQKVLESEWLADATILSNQPYYKILEETANLGKAMGMDQDALVNFVEDQVDTLNEQNPGLLPDFRVASRVFRNWLQLEETTGRDNALSGIRGGVFSGFGIANPFEGPLSGTVQFGEHGFNLRGGVLTPMNPALTFQEFGTAFMENLDDLAIELSTMPPEQVEQELSIYESLLMNFGLGTPQPLLNPTQIELLRNNIRRHRNSSTEVDALNSTLFNR